VTSLTQLGNELLINPGFETAGTGWGNYSIESANVRTGSSAIRIGTTAGGFSQGISVSAGKSYRFSGYAKSSAQDSGTVFRVYWNNPDGTTSLVTKNTFSSDYQKLTGDFTVPAGVTRATLSAWTNGGGYLYFDDVSVKEITSLAIPATVVSEGDSISAGAGSYNSLWSMATSDVKFYRQAVGGAALGFATDPATANTLYARKQAVLDRKPSSGKFIVSILIGANDLGGSDPVQYVNRLFVLTDQFRAAGARIVIGTILPQGPQAGPNWMVHNQKRATANQLIRQAVGSRIDAVADFASDPVIGPDAAGSNTLLFSDHLHPSWGAEGGHEYMYRVYKATMDRILSQP
jgi:lysophospholipase L1-like esterase